jgi:hypothetical protein
MRHVQGLVFFHLILLTGYFYNCKHSFENLGPGKVNRLLWEASSGGAQRYGLICNRQTENQSFKTVKSAKVNHPSVYICVPVQMIVRAGLKIAICSSYGNEDPFG